MPRIIKADSKATSMQISAQSNSRHLKTYHTFERVTFRGRILYWYTWSPEQVQIQHQYMDSLHVLSKEGPAGVMVQRLFPWHIWDPSIQIADHFKSAVYLSIVADKVHPFMATHYTSSTITLHVTKKSSFQGVSRDMAMTPANVSFHSAQTSTFAAWIWNSKVLGNCIILSN